MKYFIIKCFLDSIGNMLEEINHRNSYVHN